MRLTHLCLFLSVPLICFSSCLRRGDEVAHEEVMSPGGEEGGMGGEPDQGQEMGGTCEVGLGICQATGVWVTENGAERCDVDPLPPHSSELCGTGADEDCDGQINESFLGYGQACIWEDPEGNTVSGSLDCSEDRRSLICKTTDNSCDGHDNDADGRVDEGYVPESITCPPGSCAPEGLRRCINGARVSTCQQPSALTDAPELCDGFDNDCDGTTDEDLPVESISCGVGVCQAEGRRICSNGAFQDVCTPFEPLVEDCNVPGTPALDEDCDGRVNEGLDLIQCPIGPEGVPPEVERCDGVDNDYDGLIDEGLLNACGQCGEVPDELCDGEDNDCDGATDEGLLNACGFCGPLPRDVCDGLDNDCDESIDEETGMPSQTLLGICEGALTVCQAGQLVNPSYSSIPGYQSPEQSCDGLDNDCDGQVDEDITRPSGLQGVCASLVDRCDPQQLGLWIPATPSEAQGYELNEVSCADGLDNDCDGLVDALDTSDCLVEVCDGVDNDNDGEIDEGLSSTAEFCNAQDDDCDEEVDEGVPNCIDQLKTLLQYKVTWNRPAVGPEGEVQEAFSQVAHITHNQEALLSRPESGSVTKDRVDLYRAQPLDLLNLEVAVYQTNFEGAQDWLAWIKGHCSVSLAWYNYDANQGSIPEVADCDTESNCVKVNLATLGAPGMFVGSQLGRRPVLFSSEIETYSLELSCTKPGPLLSPQASAEDSIIFELLKEHVALKAKEFDADSVSSTTPEICNLNSGVRSFDEYWSSNHQTHFRYQTLTKRLDQDCEIPLFTMSPN